MTLIPGENSGNNGDIYVEAGPHGGVKDMFTTRPVLCRLASIVQDIQ